MLLRLLPFALVTAAFGQAPDAVLTQTLIDEIRALRQNIEATTVTSQRVQIVLYRLQSQTALLAGAQQRLDAARTQAIDSQSRRNRIAGEINRLEERARNTQDPAQKKEADIMLPELKANQEALAAEESQRRAAEADAESQLRSEQSRLADLQSTLDRLDKALDSLVRPKK
jgi:chromosome segregation ATPase